MNLILKHAHGSRVHPDTVDAYALSAAKPTSNAGTLFSCSRTAFTCLQQGKVSERAQSVPQRVVLVYSCGELLPFVPAIDRNYWAIVRWEVVPGYK